MSWRVLFQWFLPSALLSLSSFIVGCGGGGDTTAPEPPFPDVAGVYGVTGGFDDIPANQGSFTGTLTLTQASRQVGDLGGTFTITALINGDVISGTLPLQQATVSPTGVVSFVLSEGGSDKWTFTGNHAGTTISGRHTLTDGTTNISGDWTTGGAAPPTTGTLQITSSTGGPSPDADGYIVTIDGTERGTLGVNATGTIELAPGSHVVGLAGVAANCHVDGDNLRTVTIAPGATATVTFAVTCVEPPPSVGVLRVTTITTGADQDGNGYAFAIDGGPSQPIGVNGDVSLANIAAGSHTVTVSNVATNCTVAGGASKTVAVTAGATTTAAFSITCTAVPPAVGTVRITTTTTGQDLDGDGYAVAVDGGQSQPIGVSGEVSLNNLSTGSHTVQLTGVAGNCTVDDDSKDVTVTAGGTATVAFSITCTAIPPAVGTLRITTTTSGSDPDGDGYAYSIDGGPSQPIGLNATVSVDLIAAGTHTVMLSNVAANCTVNDDSQNVTVPAGGIADVTFSVTCTAIPPAVGSIHITTSTAGPEQDPDGYMVTVDGGASQPIGLNGEVLLSSISPGPHTVQLMGVAGNCTVDDDSKDVTVSAGATSEVSFSITCS